MIELLNAEERSKLLAAYIYTEKDSGLNGLDRIDAIRNYIQWYLNLTRYENFSVRSVYDAVFLSFRISVLYGDSAIINVRQFLPAHDINTYEAFNIACSIIEKVEKSIEEQFPDKGAKCNWRELAYGPSWNDIFDGQFKVKEDENK